MMQHALFSNGDLSRIHAPTILHVKNPLRPNAALGASALSRLLWAAGALLLLWLGFFWATA